MLTNLFKLNGTPVQFLKGNPAPNLSPNAVVENIDFRYSPWPRGARKIREVTFRNVSLSKMKIERRTFTECTFEDCIFAGTRFQEVEFHNCTIRDCTFYKARFDQVYLDPDKIELGLRYEVEAANIGVSLFQALLNNFDDTRQDEFFAKADMSFRRWKRYQLSHDVRNGHIGKWVARGRRLASCTYELVAGFGYRPWRFVVTTLILFFLFSCFNHIALSNGLAANSGEPGPTTFIDSVYYTFSILTVLGFSTVFPTTPWAKMLTVAEALAAIGWLGIFTSLLVKRFLR